MNAIDLNDIDMTPAPAPANPNAASEKQINFINALIEQADDSTPQVQAHLANIRKALDEGIERREASFIIDGLKGLPRKAAPAAAPAPTEDIPEGMHLLEGAFYKVVTNRAGDRKYAKRLEMVDSGLYDGEQVHPAKFAFEYAAGAIRHLSAATVMPAEEAARFGATYGICVNCGRTLTHESSVAHGYGPVCAEKNGWAWGDVPTYEVAAV